MPDFSFVKITTDTTTETAVPPITLEAAAWTNPLNILLKTARIV